MNKRWNSICGHYFWNNEIGVKKFCKEFGYSNGTINEEARASKAREDHFRFGQCNEDDRWPACNGGCNDMKLGGKCSENEAATCEKGSNVQFYVTCSGDYDATKANERKCTCM